MSEPKRRAQKLNRQREGSALLVAVMMLMLMGLIGIAALDTMTKDRQVAGFQQRARLAFYAADAGVAQGLNLVLAAPSRNFVPAFPAVPLGDAVIYPNGQPAFRGDPLVPNPVVYAQRDGGPVQGMNLQVPVQFVNTLWEIRVQGQTPDGGTSNLEAMATKMLDNGY
jgi:hypothetical protein